MILVLYEYFDDLTHDWNKDWEVGHFLQDIVKHINASYSKRTIRNIKGFEGNMIPIESKIDLKEVL